MKIMILTITMLCICSILIESEINWHNALNAAINSEGSDMAIEEAMVEYGFNLAWYETPSELDKVKALFTIDHRSKVIHSVLDTTRDLTSIQFIDNKGDTMGLDYLTYEELGEYNMNHSIRDTISD